MTAREFQRLGIRNGVGLVETGIDGSSRSVDVMAFDRPDTDALFAVMKRALKPLGIVPRRVDRIEHNDNIDQKIISELTEAALVIADLTYARPSVYFEAGYAQREALSEHGG